MNDSEKTRWEERDERMRAFLRHIDSGRDERRENSGRRGSGATRREESRRRGEAPSRGLRRIPHCPSLWWRSRQGARAMVCGGVKLTWRWPWHKGAEEEGARRCVAGLPRYGHSGLACCFCVCDALPAGHTQTHGTLAFTSLPLFCKFVPITL